LKLKAPKKWNPSRLVVAMATILLRNSRICFNFCIFDA